MGLVYVIFATLLNSAKGFCSKKVSRKINCFADNLNLSLLRSLMCLVVGIVFLLLNKIVPSMSLAGWAICVASGIAISVYYIVWVLALKTDAYMFVSAANSSSFIVAALGGIILFGERLSVTKCAAILVMLLAMYFMTKYQTEFGGKPTAKEILLLLTVFLTQGFSQLTQKLFTYSFPDVSVHIYTFCSFVVSVVLLIMIRWFVKYPGEKKEEIVIAKRLLPFTAVMGVAHYGVTYFQALASSKMEAIVLYPLNNGLALVAGLIMSWIAFKEKPSKNSIIGIILVFLALLLTRF